MKNIFKKMYKALARLFEPKNDLTYEQWLRIEHRATHSDTNFNSHIR